MTDPSETQQPADPVVRLAKPTDINFILSTWLKAYRKSDYAEQIPAKTYFTHHHDVLGRILTRPGTSTLVAHPPGDEDTILGYAVLEATTAGPVVHWVYVKLAFRSLGIAKQLLSGIDLNQASFSHFPKDGESLDRKWPNLQFNPYAQG